jgi:hypothetical protein
VNKSVWLLTMCLFSAVSYGQEKNVSESDAPVPPATEKKSDATDKKMIGSANINLRTTVTGNQEQPRVMYILPWQSPLSPDLEMEMLSSQEDAVFGHIERDELQRNLEAAGEYDQADN